MRREVGYHQMIQDLMEKEPDPQVMPWVTATAIASQPYNSQTDFVTPGGHPVQPPPWTEPLIYESVAEAEEEFDIWAIEPEEQPTVVFEFEGWQIEAYGETGSSECDWVSHYCEYYKWKYRIDMWQLMADGVCPECCEKVPEEVMAVWKLKNFDKLPGEDEAKRWQGGNIISLNESKLDEDTQWWA